MVCDHDKALGKVAFNSSVCGLDDLVSNALVAGDADHRGCPPLCYCGDENSKVFFCSGHVLVVPSPVDEVKRASYKLCRKSILASGCGT